MKRLVIGIIAHVDSGKTTLSESILFHTGKIRKMGRVDHKDAFLDNNSIERDRGITIFSSQAVFTVDDTEFTLLDTPGHVDFSAETERVLNVLDYAVLVISGTDGVQSHTETLWKLLEKYNIPVFIFINKMDISAYDRSVLLKNLKSRLGDGCTDFSVDSGEGFYESLAMCDMELMNSYIEKSAVDTEQIRDAVKKRRVFPCCFGAALKSDGVPEFLRMLCKYTREPQYGAEFGAKVFKITKGEQGERLTHMKITGGLLKVKDMICTSKQNGTDVLEKVNQIRIYSGSGYRTAAEVPSGSVCAVTGLRETFPGKGLGAEPSSHSSFLEPVLNYRVVLPSGLDAHTALQNLRLLEEEDPQLHIVWNEQLQEINVRIMGEIQLEVLRRIFSERFGADIDFDNGSIAYKETIEVPTEGAGHYEPLRHYAEVHLLLEPGERGSGLIFETNCSEDVLSKNWQRLILTHLNEKTHRGVLTGFPVTDMKITLTAGRAHLKHTEGGDFRQATYRAVRQGLMCAKSILLEPWYSFTLEIPSDCIGRAMSDIQQMGGTFSQPQSTGDTAVISGSAPAASMRGYHTDVTGYTKGRGRLSCSFKGYDICHNAEEVIKAIGYDPEKDIDNTADSVFCSHGAGFTVKWNEVQKYMHVSGGTDYAETEPEQEPGEANKRAAGYLNTIASDKELMEIFERTYGKISRPEHTVLKTQKMPSAPKKAAKPKPAKSGREYLLVDGYNIIFAWDELKKLAGQSLDLARNALINTMCSYGGFRQCEVILVFDAYKVKRNAGDVEKIHNISVVYTKEAETADMYIEKVTHELGRTNRVRVATSDSLEQLIILANGAVRVSADAFHLEVKQTEKEIKEFLKTLK